MAGKKRPTVNCPRCSAAVRWGPDSPFRPFCSERCKMNDLGAWANEEYRVAVQMPDNEMEDRPETSEDGAI